jgi:hypothetical protein
MSKPEIIYMNADNRDILYKFQGCNLIDHYLPVNACIYR